DARNEARVRVRGHVRCGRPDRREGADTGLPALDPEAALIDGTVLPAELDRLGCRHSAQLTWRRGHERVDTLEVGRRRIRVWNAPCAYADVRMQVVRVDEVVHDRPACRPGQTVRRCL